MAEEFKFKPFEEMTPEDYAKIGFKSGLEVHQQLFTEKKLFCRCPAGQYCDEYHAEILRHMRPTLSELGEYDGTALMEFKTKKNIIYRINRNTVCTYEMDDTPPFEINPQALDIALEISMMYGASIVDEVHIARKQYLDGSIPTGFQRTAIVSVGGRIPYKDGRYIDLIQMSIEEDACREVSDLGHQRVYFTDRLGMPLIETVTQPLMTTPQEIAEVNQIIRRIGRNSGKVRTGEGAAREDVNVSVTGGTRIEIKGVPSIKAIPLLAYNEAMRQWNLLRLRDELHRRHITPETFQADTNDITRILKKTTYAPVSQALQQGMVAKCVTLRGFNGLLNWRTQTDTNFSKEIADRVRVIACIANVPNIIHSDSFENTLNSIDGQKIRKAVAATENDAMVIVWGTEDDTETAVKEIIIRAKEATIGIPQETRQALKDGTNGFERILPGPERMYPDTDLPPQRVTQERLDRIKSGIQEFYWNREKWYNELNLPKDVIPDLAISKYANIFSDLVKNDNSDPKFASIALVQFMKRLTKMKKNVNNLTPEIMKKILLAYKAGKIVKEGVFVVMEKIADAGKYTENMLPKPATDDKIKETIASTGEKLKKIKLYSQDNFEILHFASVMNTLRGKVNGEYVKNLMKISK